MPLILVALSSRYSLLAVRIIIEFGKISSSNVGFFSSSVSSFSYASLFSSLFSSCWSVPAFSFGLVTLGLGNFQYRSSASLYDDGYPSIIKPLFLQALDYNIAFNASAISSSDGDYTSLSFWLNSLFRDYAYFNASAVVICSMSYSLTNILEKNVFPTHLGPFTAILIGFKFSLLQNS